MFCNYLKVLLSIIILSLFSLSAFAEWESYKIDSNIVESSFTKSLKGIGAWVLYEHKTDILERRILTIHADLVSKKKLIKVYDDKLNQRCPDYIELWKEEDGDFIGTTYVCPKKLKKIIDKNYITFEYKDKKYNIEPFQLFVDEDYYKNQLVDWNHIDVNSKKRFRVVLRNKEISKDALINKNFGLDFLIQISLKERKNALYSFELNSINGSKKLIEGIINSHIEDTCEDYKIEKQSNYSEDFSKTNIVTFSCPSLISVFKKQIIAEEEFEKAEKARLEAIEKKRIEEEFAKKRLELEETCKMYGFKSNTEAMNSCLIMQMKMQADAEEKQNLLIQLDEAVKAAERAQATADLAGKRAALAEREAREAREVAEKRVTVGGARKQADEAIGALKRQNPCAFSTFNIVGSTCY